MAPSNLNLPEELLKILATFNGIGKHALTHNLTSTLPVDGPNDLHAGTLGDIASQLTRLPQNTALLRAAMKTAMHGGLTNDKDYLLEYIVQLAASFPSDSKNGALLSSLFIKTLWTNLRHPPLSYLGDEWRYRTADGSNNNRLFPHIGKGGSPYARTLAPTIQLPPSLPDPGLIFDELFARGDKIREHPNKLSSMLFYFASIIIHDVFRTNDRDWNKVDSSSYLDLGPLYGHNQEQQDSVRTHKNGLLHPDAFAEIRLLGFPPGVAALLVCFNRFHNYIALQLAQINEGGRFTPRPGCEQKLDNDLFQTARLITCGLYINIVLIDYVRTILNLNRSNTDWVLDPRANMTDVITPKDVDQGIGNQVSVEFNLVYRWHSAISASDEEWSNKFFAKAFPGIEPSKVSQADLRIGFAKFLHTEENIDPKTRTFGDLTRKPDGSFEDADLVRLLSDATEDVAGAFGARNVPAVMRVIEMLGIEQARSWNVATLNEFRKYFGLVPHKSFSDISSKPDVATSLETLYGHPDLVELYPGLVVEDAKEPMDPGAGLCPGYTISRTILADAVALVRGDRFYTIDYNSTSMTNWGFTQASPNKLIAEGCVMYKLFMKAFPGFYRGNSVYAFYPFTVPDENKKILHHLGKEADFDFGRPHFIGPPKSVTTYKEVVKILKDPTRFKVPWGKNTFYITHHDFMLSGDCPANQQEKDFAHNAIYSPKDGMEEITKLYEETTISQLRTTSHRLRHGYAVDVVADVGNLAIAIAVAQFWGIPLKSPHHSFGLFTPIDFYNLFSYLFAWVFLDQDPASEFGLRLAAKTAAIPLKAEIKAVVEGVKHMRLNKAKEWIGWANPAKDVTESYGTKLIRRLLDSGKSSEDITAMIIPTMTGSVATQAQGFAQMIDLFLSDEYYHEHWPVIEELARSDDADDFEKLRKYALEGFRLATASFGLVRKVDAESVTIEDGEHIFEAKKGDQIFVDFVHAGLDETVFPEPRKIKLDRPRESYIHHGAGTHSCLGKDMVNYAMAAQLRALGKLKGVRRMPGSQGQLKYLTVGDTKAVRVYLKADYSDFWPFPSTLKIIFDGFGPGMETEREELDEQIKF